MNDTRFAPGYVWCFDWTKPGKEPNPHRGLAFFGTPEEAAEIYLRNQRQRRPRDRHRCWTLTGPDAEPVLIELPPLWAS